MAFIQQAPVGPTVLRSERSVPPLCFSSQLSECPQVGENPQHGLIRWLLWAFLAPMVQELMTPLILK